MLRRTFLVVACAFATAGLATAAPPPLNDGDTALRQALQQRVIEGLNRRVTAVEQAQKKAAPASDRREETPAGNSTGFRLPFQEIEVVVPETGEVRMDFTLGVKNLPKY